MAEPSIGTKPMAVAGEPGLVKSPWAGSRNCGIGDERVRVFALALAKRRAGAAEGHLAGSFQ
jgi:hypothetical protein